MATSENVNAATKSGKPGLLWSIPSAEPIIRPGQLNPQYDAKRASAAHVIRMGDKYRMVYWGSADGKHYILQAEAPVGRPNDWKAIGGPLLGPQPDADYNFEGPSFPFLLPVTEKRWLMYFCAWGKRRGQGDHLANTTGVAVSDDGGNTWQYPLTKPVIAMDRPYDAKGTGSVWVLHEGGKFRMYYTAIGKHFPKPEGVQTGHGDVIPFIGIAYAESDDGLTWRKPFDDLLVKPREFGVDPYEYIVSKPVILKDERGYTLWVNTFGTAYRIHRLTSTDGLKWEWAKRQGPDGELGTGNPGAFDDQQRSYPTMVRDGNKTLCWYTGNRFGLTGMGFAVGAE